MSKAKQSTPVSARSPRLAALVRRLAGGPAWIGRNKLLAAVVLGVAVVPVAPILVAYLSRPVVRAEPKRLPTLRSALKALDKGDLGLAAELARELERPGLLKSNELGGPALIAGLVACRQAEGRSPSAARQYLEIAVNDLTRAQMLGFPQGRRAEGTFWLGKCLLLTGRAEQSRPILVDALKRNPRTRTEIHGLLAAALMTGRSPRPATALEHCVAAKHFESAAELASAASAVWGEIRTTQLVGKAQEQWGRRMLDDAQSIPAPRAAELVQEGRRHLREAGATYRRLARLRTEQREYPDDLFQAAEQFQEGHDFDAAIEAYQEYLDNDTV